MYLEILDEVFQCNFHIQLNFDIYPSGMKINMENKERLKNEKEVCSIIRDRYLYFSIFLDQLD